MLTENTPTNPILMKFPKIVLWSVMHGKKHEKVTEDELSRATTALTATLFPGLNGAPEELPEVMEKFVIPALKKKLPDLVICEPKDLSRRRLLVKPFLAGNGHDWKMEWWKIEFYTKLTAA